MKTVSTSRAWRWRRRVRISLTMRRGSTSEETVPGLRRPKADLRHKECARVSQRPQRGPQGRRPRRRRSLLGAVAARRGGNGARGRDGEVPSAAAKAEQVARRGEERGRGHGERRGGWRVAASRALTCRRHYPVRVLGHSFGIWALAISVLGQIRRTLSLKPMPEQDKTFCIHKLWEQGRLT